MLNSKELKLVLETLTKRRAWLMKSLQDNSVEDKLREEHIESAKLIDSALKKLALMNSGSKPAPTVKPAEEAKSSKPPPDKDPIPLDKAKILIAEDDPDSSKLLQDILEGLGLKHIDVAANGKEAFDKLKAATEPYHVVLCDWDMPEMNGLEVHKSSKALSEVKFLHFMMVTAVSEAARIREAIQSGVSDYVVKPIDIDTLEGKVRAALGH